MLKTEELRSLSREELRDKIEALKKSLYEIRTQAATGRIEKPSRIKEARRGIARILTIMREKEKQ